MPDNVAAGVTSLPRDAIEDAWLPFELSDLQRIYSAELSQKAGVAIETLFWVLLLAPFTGCRLDELGSLRPGNVRRYDGIDYMAIEVDRRRVREQQDLPKKRVKTASAKRDIPIHPLLIEAGFLNMVERRREEKAEWLFPELQANKYGSRTQRLSRVINNFLDEIGLSDPELVFHSFRHTGKRAIRGKVQADIVDLLFGHADESVSSKYGRGADMQTLHDAIVKLNYSEVDWKTFTAAFPVNASTQFRPYSLSRLPPDFGHSLSRIAQHPSRCQAGRSSLCSYVPGIADRWRLTLTSNSQTSWSA